jgi:mono/diheme cytochrome c family protein
VTTFNELALNGKQSYGDNCFNCHGDSFTNGSAGYAILSEYQDAQKLLEIISRMPNSGEQEQWEVLSYLLLEHEWVSETATFNADTLSQISLTQ